MLRKLRGICSDALRAASLSDEFIALGQANTPFSRIGGLEHLSFKKCSRHCPAIAQALGLLSSRALPSCATDRLSARDGEEINHRAQTAPRLLSAQCETFDNQQRKDVKAKQHWCPLKQNHPTAPHYCGRWIRSQRPKSWRNALRLSKPNTRIKIQKARIQNESNKADSV